MHRPGGQQYLLLDPEVALPVAVPEVEKDARRLLQIACFAQLLRGQQGNQVLA
jgi:hypothetical protein